MLEIFENNKKWAENKRREDPRFFTNMVKGQNPKYLFIGCSDSRVPAETIMGVGPGEVFVLRNVANLVNNIDLSAIAVVEYAVKHLHVLHIIICGHYYCGGIKAAMERKDYGLLSPWLRSIKTTYRIHREEIDKLPDVDQKYARISELSVQEQCGNLLRISCVREAFAQRRIDIYGCMFNISTGELKNLQVDIQEIYDHPEEMF